MAAGENRLSPELSENEVVEQLENATPGSTKNDAKYGMKIFQSKKLYFDNLSIQGSQSKTMQVETVFKLIKSLVTFH